MLTTSFGFVLPEVTVSGFTAYFTCNSLVTATLNFLVLLSVCKVCFHSEAGLTTIRMILIFEKSKFDSIDLHSLEICAKNTLKTLR